MNDEIYRRFTWARLKMINQKTCLKPFLSPKCVSKFIFNKVQFNSWANYLRQLIKFQKKSYYIISIK